MHTGAADDLAFGRRNRARQREQVVEGICASGRSLSYLLRNFETRHPASLRVCAFVARQRPRPADVVLHYLGREIPDTFVVGYGLDAQERYRHLPYIARFA